MINFGLTVCKCLGFVLVYCRVLSCPSWFLFLIFFHTSSSIIVCSVKLWVSPCLHPLWRNITFYKTKAANAEILIHNYLGPSAQAISQWGRGKTCNTSMLDMITQKSWKITGGNYIQYSNWQNLRKNTKVNAPSGRTSNWLMEKSLL